MIAPFRPSALLPPSDEDAPGWAAAWATLAEETVHLVTLHHRYACHTATSHLPRHTPRMPPRHATRTHRVTPHVTLMAASAALISSCVPLWRFSDHATPVRVLQLGGAGSPRAADSATVHAALLCDGGAGESR